MTLDTMTGRASVDSHKSLTCVPARSVTDSGHSEGTAEMCLHHNL